MKSCSTHENKNQNFDHFSEFIQYPPELKIGFQLDYRIELTNQILPKLSYIPKIILDLSPSPASVAITLELQKIIQFCKKFQYYEELLYP